MAQSDRSNLIWTNDIIITWHSWLVFSCIRSQWACCSIFKYLAFICCSSSQRTSETLHLPQLHVFRSARMWFINVIWGYSYVQQQYFLHAHSSMLWMYWQWQVSVLALTQQMQRSRSIPPRPNTLTLSGTLPCQPLWELSWQNIYNKKCKYITALLCTIHRIISHMRSITGNRLKYIVCSWAMLTDWSANRALSRSLSPSVVSLTAQTYSKTCEKVMQPHNFTCTLSFCFWKLRVQPWFVFWQHSTLQQQRYNRCVNADALSLIRSRSCFLILLS